MKIDFIKINGKKQKVSYYSTKKENEDYLTFLKKMFTPRTNEFTKDEIKILKEKNLNVFRCPSVGVIRTNKISNEEIEYYKNTYKVLEKFNFNSEKIKKIKSQYNIISDNSFYEDTDFSF